MNKKAIIEIKKFAEWFLSLSEIELSPGHGAVASFSFETILWQKVGKLKFSTLQCDENFIQLDFDEWIRILNKYLLAKNIDGSVKSFGEWNSKNCGTSIIMEVEVNQKHYDGIYFAENL
jgi:hypothetical protein